jgi:hypothetical protein
MNHARLALIVVATAVLAVPAGASAQLPYVEQEPVYKAAEHSRHETAKNSVGNIR